MRSRVLWPGPRSSAVLRSDAWPEPRVVSFKSGDVAPASRPAIAPREVCDIQGPRGPKMSDSSPLSPTLVPTRGPGHARATRSPSIPLWGGGSSHQEPIDSALGWWREPPGVHRFRSGVVARATRSPSIPLWGGGASHQESADSVFGDWNPLEVRAPNGANGPPANRSQWHPIASMKLVGAL